MDHVFVYMLKWFFSTPVVLFAIFTVAIATAVAVAGLEIGRRRFF